jgi:hypothetical protein
MCTAYIDIRDYETYIEYTNYEDTNSRVDYNDWQDGKEKLDNPYSFDTVICIGNDNYQSRIIAGATSLYNNTGIQLYYAYYDYGKAEFTSRTEIQKETISQIESLENSDYSIIVYEYSTDYDYGDKYYYYAYDCFYYGSKVRDYLSTSDLKLIEYYYQNAYNIWDYSNRESEMWTTVGSNIKDGYSLNAIKEKYDPVVNENMISYYEDDIASAKTRLGVYTVASIISLTVLFLRIFRNAKLRKLENEKKQAEIELMKSQATANILNTPMQDLVNSKADEILNKYDEGKK